MTTHHNDALADPFAAGSAAFRRGEEIQANPFVIGSEKFRLWEHGWLDAKVPKKRFMSTREEMERQPED